MSIKEDVDCVLDTIIEHAQVLKKLGYAHYDSADAGELNRLKEELELWGLAFMAAGAVQDDDAYEMACQRLSKAQH